MDGGIILTSDRDHVSSDDDIGEFWCFCYSILWVCLIGPIWFVGEVECTSCHCGSEFGLGEAVHEEVLIVSDPRADGQAVKEAASAGVPVVALCSTDNEFSGVDLVIPTNNKGRRALAVIYWLLARQELRERGEIPPDKDLPSTVEDFEAKISRGEEET